MTAATLIPCPRNGACGSQSHRSDSAQFMICRANSRDNHRGGGSQADLTRLSISSREEARFRIADEDPDVYERNVKLALALYGNVIEDGRERGIDPDGNERIAGMIDFDATELPEEGQWAMRRGSKASLGGGSQIHGGYTAEVVLTDGSRVTMGFECDSLDDLRLELEPELGDFSRLRGESDYRQLMDPSAPSVAKTASRAANVQAFEDSGRKAKFEAEVAAARETVRDYGFDPDTYAVRDLLLQAEKIETARLVAESGGRYDPYAPQARKTGGDKMPREVERPQKRGFGRLFGR